MDPQELAQSDLDKCARILIGLEKLQGGHFLQGLIFGHDADQVGETFNFERCTLIVKQIPAHVEDYLSELLSIFGRVLHVVLRRKRGSGKQSWAFLTFAHAESVEKVLKAAAADKQGRIALTGNRYANLGTDEVVWLLPTRIHSDEAVSSTGFFAEAWQAARKQAQQKLEAHGTLAAYSNYRPDVVRHLKIRWVQKGSVLWEQGDLSDDCFYFLVAGCVEVTSGRSDQRAGIDVVNELYPGSTFGDVATLSDFSLTLGKRSAGIRAVSDAVLLTLTRIDYLHLTGEYRQRAVQALRKHPRVRNVMDHGTLKDLFDGCGLYGSSPTSAFSDRIARAATYVQVKKNETLFKQYDDAEHFYIVVNGYVRVVADGQFVGCLGPGTMFGEAGVTGETDAQRKRTATIIGGFIPGSEGAPTVEMLAEEMEASRRQRALKLGAHAVGTVYEHADLAEVSREDFLKVTAGTTEAIKTALATRGVDRTEDQLELLFGLLMHTTFFKFLATPAVQKRACQVLQLRACHRGETLFEEGDIEEAPLFYIIVQGKVEGRMRGQPSFVLEAGASFGEIAVIAEEAEAKRRTVTMKCVADTIFGTLSQAHYVEITSGLENRALGALCTRPSGRTQRDIEVMQRYFEQNKLFKMIGFPAMQKEVLKRLVVRPVEQKRVVASLATEDGDEDGDSGDSSAFCQQFGPTEGSIFIVMRGALTVFERSAVSDDPGGKDDGEDDSSASPKQGQTSLKPSANPMSSGAESLGQQVVSTDESPFDEVEVERYQVGYTFCNLLPGGQLPDVPIPGRPSPVLVMQNQSTIYAMPPDVELTDSSAVIVGPIPKKWTTHELYLKFKSVGDIAKIEFITTGRVARRRGQWAQITFVTVAAAQMATRKNVYIENISDGPRPSNGAVASLTPLIVEYDRQGKARPSEMDKAASEVYDELMAADAVVAELTMPDFNKICVAFLTNVFSILNELPRTRTLPMLATLVDFLEPTEFMQGMKSAMVRRNATRYLSMHIAEPGQRLYKYGSPITAIYIVLRGTCQLDTGKTEPIEKGVGATLQGPASLPTVAKMEKEGPGTYEYTATAVGDTPLVLAKMSVKDYLRTCSLEGIQKMIDMYFQLGIDFQQSKATQRRERAAKEAEESGRGGQGSIELKDTEEYNNVLRFSGYKQVYMRIGKSLASNGRYSQAELIECMASDWEQDLEEFGDTEEALKLTEQQAIAANMIGEFDRTEEDHGQLLTREQYTQSLYQLIDEWSGSVESTKLYEQILQLVLDNSSAVAGDGKNASVRRKKKQASNNKRNSKVDAGERKKPGDPGYLVLKPLRQVDCIFQQLADMRVYYQKLTREARVKAEISESAKESTALKKLTKGRASLAMGLGLLESMDGVAEDKVLEKLTKTFNEIDADGSGSISRDEVGQLALKNGRTLQGVELDAALAEMDTDNDGVVILDEFVDWYKRMMDDSEMLKAAFTAVDADGSGSLNKWEIETVLLEMGELVTPEALDKAMKTMDDDHSGEVTFAEFYDWWNVYMSEQTKERLIKEDPVRKYRYKQFTDVGLNAAGELDRTKLRDLMSKLGREVTDAELDWLMVIVDTNVSDGISFDEFEQFYEVLTVSDLSLDTFFHALLPPDDDGSEMISPETMRSTVRKLCAMENVNITTAPDVQQFLQKHSEVGVSITEFKDWWGHFRLVHCSQNIDNASDSVEVLERSDSDDVTVSTEAVRASCFGDESESEYVCPALP